VICAYHAAAMHLLAEFATVQHHAIEWKCNHALRS
jgi:hypothetical protein